MIIVLFSCFSLAALVLLGTASWMYFNQKQNVDAESKTQLTPIITAGLGLFACFLAVVLLAIYIWGFINFSA